MEIWNMAETYFADFRSSFPKPRFIGGGTLIEARINACKVARQYPGQRIAIYKRKGSRETGWRGSEFKEEITYLPDAGKYLRNTLNGTVLVSPKTGKIMTGRSK